MSQSQDELRSQETQDRELDAVFKAVQNISDFERRAAKTIREAVDDVIHGHKTGRYSIEQLTRQEKAHIGTQVEIALMRDLFGNREGKVLDTIIADTEVDIKNTIGNNWMIPPEAVGRICLLISISESSRAFSVGVFRAEASVLNRPNRDKKHTISAAGIKRIRWIVRDGKLSVSVFLQLTPDTLKDIWEPATRGRRSGQACVNELFRRIQKKVISRTDLETLAQQMDPAKRARDAKKALAHEGILVFCGRYDGQELRRRGLNLDADEWISVKE